MLNVADRIIGQKYQGVSKYDNARNDLSAAIYLIPKDIIQCDGTTNGRKTYHQSRIWQGRASAYGPPALNHWQPVVP